MSTIPTSINLDLRTLGYASASVGAAFWIAGIHELQLSWGPAMLLLASLVLVPLTLVLAVTPDRQVGQPTAWPWVFRLSLPAGLLLLVSFAFPPGLQAAALAGPWCLWTVLIAGLGLRQAWDRRSQPIEEVSIDIGLIYLAVGGFWTVLARLGARPLAFPDAIVSATAVHFHFAGLILPILAGLAGQRLRSRWSRAACVGVAVGVPLVACGITLGAFGLKIVELVAAWFLAGAGLLVAAVQLRVAMGFASGPSRVLAGVSACALAVGMVLAVVYSLGTYAGADWLDVPQMLATHGAINALGFAFPGLLAWNLEARREGCS